jgi:glycosyltransferase involved in cell wall biosynthesis
MIAGKRVVVVLPAYNAAETLKQTFNEIPKDFVDTVLLVDDGSSDNTASIARGLGMIVVRHERNLGYGANQKTCYRKALELGADIIVMLHPDYQYPPRMVPAMICMIAYGKYDLVLGSRILGGEALTGGMPAWRYVGNRILTFIQNILLGTKISEFHTGFRAYTREVLLRIPFDRNSDDFVFDNQMLAQAVWAGFKVGEISCEANYFKEASSISFSRAIRYALGVLATSCDYALNRDSAAHPVLRRPTSDQELLPEVHGS